MKLDHVVPFGRSRREYELMFDLSSADPTDWDFAYKDNLQEGCFLDHNGYSHARDAKNAVIPGDWEKNGRCYDF